MHIRRPVAALVTALALAGGGMLAGCSNGGDSNTGTPADNTSKTSTSPGANSSMGNLPTDSNRVTSSGADRAGQNGKGTP
jgi:hypothetical protein